MADTRFDTIAKLFAERRLSRRKAMQQGSAALAAGALGAAALRVPGGAAQDATPSGSDAATPAVLNGEKIPYFFVQSFQNGTIAPKAGEEGTYTLTLEQGLGQTIFFSDRPERVVGATATPKFLDAIGFAPNNPPNAALVAELPSGETAISVVELYSPVYDEATHTATYDVKVLSDWEDSLDMGFAAAPTDLAAVAPSFEAAHLFIDDCPDLTTCVILGVDPIGLIPGAPIGMCWDSWQALCLPCDHRSIDELEQLCNNTFDQCGHSCVVY